MSNTELYWICANLVPAGLWHVIVLYFPSEEAK